MDAARASALKLTRNQFSELRSMRKPPETVLVIVEALRLLFVDSASRKKNQASNGVDWNQHKLMLKNPGRLRSRLKSLDVNSLGFKQIQALRQILDRHEITLRTIPRLSSVCQALAKYLLAVCSSWQATEDLMASQKEQRVANERYDANAQAIIGLEKKVEVNRKKMSALQKDYDEQMSLQQKPVP